MESDEEQKREDQVYAWFTVANKPGYRKVAERAGDTNNIRKVILIGLKEMKVSWRTLKRAYNLRKVMSFDLLSLYELLLYLKVWALEKKKTDIEFPPKTAELIMSDDEVHMKKGIHPGKMVRLLAYSTNRLIRKARRALAEKQKKKEVSLGAGLKYDRRFLNGTWVCEDFLTTGILSDYSAI